MEMVEEALVFRVLCYLIDKQQHAGNSSHLAIISSLPFT